MTIYLNPPQQRPGPMAGFGQGAQVLSNAFQNAELNKVLENAAQNPEMKQHDIMQMLFSAPNLSPQMKMQGAQMVQQAFPQRQPEKPVNLQQITGTGQSFNPRTGEARDIPGYVAPTDATDVANWVNVPGYPGIIRNTLTNETKTLEDLPAKDADEANWVNVPGYPGVIRNTKTNETKTLDDLPAKSKLDGKTRYVTETWWNADGSKGQETFENPTSKILNAHRAQVKADGGRLGKPQSLTGAAADFRSVHGRAPIDNAELRMFLEELRLPPQPTKDERSDARLKEALPNLIEAAAQDPNKAHTYGYRMNDDGTVWVDKISGLPYKKRPFDKVTGKRANMKIIMNLGELHDDAREVNKLLGDDGVKRGLGAFYSSRIGLPGRISSKWKNTVNRWLAENGYGDNSKTAEVVYRLQNMASEERKEKLGTAVTKTELQTILAWIPNAGDNYQQILSKMNVATHESGQHFRRYLNVFDWEGDMSPFYKQFDIQRFGKTPDANIEDDPFTKYGVTVGG